MPAGLAAAAVAEAAAGARAALTAAAGELAAVEGFLQCGAGAALAAAVVHARTPAVTTSVVHMTRKLASCSAAPAPRSPRRSCMRAPQPCLLALFT